MPEHEHEGKYVVGVDLGAGAVLVDLGVLQHDARGAPRLQAFDGESTHDARSWFFVAHAPLHAQDVDVGEGAGAIEGDARLLGAGVDADEGAHWPSCGIHGTRRLFSS